MSVSVTIQLQNFQQVTEIPSIELSNISNTFFSQNSYKVGENILPDTAFNVMQGIYYKHLKKVKTMRGESFRKGTLSSN